MIYSVEERDRARRRVLDRARVLLRADEAPSSPTDWSRSLQELTRPTLDAG